MSARLTNQFSQCACTEPHPSANLNVRSLYSCFTSNWTDDDLDLLGQDVSYQCPSSKIHFSTPTASRLNAAQSSTQRHFSSFKKNATLSLSIHELAIPVNRYDDVARMKEILERYSKNPDGIQAGRIGDNSDYMSREVMKLRQQLEHSQHTQRHMLGEDLTVLSVPDLLQLEQQLDVGVSRVRQRKSQLLLEEIEELRRKEHKLHEENEELRRKLVDAKGIADAAARGLPGLGSNLQSPNARSESAATQSVPQVYPLQPNLRDPHPTSQPSLQLGLFAQSSSRSRGPAHQNSGPENEATSRPSEWMLQ